MNSIKEKAFAEIGLIISSLKEAGIATTPVAENQYSYESVANKGGEKVKVLVFFGKSGIKKILQGNKESGLYTELFNIVTPSIIATSSPATAAVTGFKEPEAYIGTDESGKGDFFGPLVVAGVGANKLQLEQLKKAGVKDSKELSGGVIKSLAGKIKSICPESHHIIVITPATYNRLHSQFGNVNKLLGWGHAKVLENILGKISFSTAISDKFGDEKIIHGYLQEEGKKLLLHQFTKAERFPAVAAASIIARDRFNDWFDYQKKELKIELPKGASAKVDEAASQVYSLFGGDKLNELTKIHFKNSLRIKRS